MQKPPDLPDDLADLEDLDAAELPGLLALYSVAPPRLPAEPTQCRPGSRGKIEVMRRRFLRGERIFHEQDLTIQTMSDDLEQDTVVLPNGRVYRDAEPLRGRRSA